MAPKIGILTAALEAGHPSYSNYTRGLFRALLRLRPDVEWWTVGPAAQVPELSGQPRLRIPAAHLQPLRPPWRPWWSGACQVSPLDLLHDGTGSMLFTARPRCRSVVTIHDLTSLVMPGQNLRGWVSHRLLGRRVCRNADRVIAISESAKRDLVRYHGVPAEKVAVVYNGLGERFRPAARADADRVRDRYRLAGPFLLFVGVLQPRKNVPALVRAYAAARAQGLEWPLVIGGIGPEAARVSDMAARLGVADRVVMLGRVPDADLPALYSAAEVFAFPSLYEGFGWPPLEAMACGIPVVCSNRSSLPEVVGDAALQVEPDESDQLRDAILRLAGDPDLRAEYRCRGLARAAQFSWERCARETWRVYEELL
ncbi:MAG TPA: glycosyltransferase family 1 protein [Opitutaceae bacterium]|nr:glycosyltransferase family 1 protein [Opitutaceae bacterium]